MLITINQIKEVCVTFFTNFIPLNFLFSSFPPLFLWSYSYFGGKKNTSRIVYTSNCLNFLNFMHGPFLSQHIHLIFSERQLTLLIMVISLQKRSTDFNCAPLTIKSIVLSHKECWEIGRPTENGGQSRTSSRKRIKALEKQNHAFLSHALFTIGLYDLFSGVHTKMYFIMKFYSNVVFHIFMCTMIF